MTSASPALSLALCALMLLYGAAFAAAARDPGKPDAATAESRSRYQQERAACASGRSNQDRATCLREAAAAHAAIQHGGLEDPAGQYEHNAVQRCARLPGPERQDCDARMHGQGTTSGSVEAGGIYRELVTRDIPPASTGKP